MKRKRNWFLAGIFIGTITINILAWHNKSFCDWMRRYVFFAFQYVQGHISSLFPFSVGEFLLYLAVLLIAAALVFGIVLLAMWIKRMRVKKTGQPVKMSPGNGLRRFIVGYYDTLLWIFAVVSIIMSTNCFVLYHCSSFQENYIPVREREYTVEELALVRDYVVTQCNELAQEMNRDEDGFILYDGDMEEQAILEMRRLGEKYPLLKGYYPKPKKLAFSGFFSQQYILGYYFPFSMEANYNRTMYIANVPVTLCHELSHVRGFIYEDDANFIGYLACVSSDDAFFRYSGYLSVVDYLNKDLYENLGNSRETYLSYAQCSPLVESDNVFLTKQAWEEVESNAVIDTETVKKASRNFLETNLQLNGVEAGIASYGEVVERLLQYYDGVLFDV